MPKIWSKPKWCVCVYIKMTANDTITDFWTPPALPSHKTCIFAKQKSGSVVCWCISWFAPLKPSFHDCVLVVGVNLFLKKQELWLFPSQHPAFSRDMSNCWSKTTSDSLWLWALHPSGRCAANSNTKHRLCGWLLAQLCTYSYLTMIN